MDQITIRWQLLGPFGTRTVFHLEHASAVLLYFGSVPSACDRQRRSDGVAQRRGSTRMI